ncbi:MAG: GNAT family N-acetyltransferase [Rhizobiaceae bacterium]|nr:GNAT family N-acetyltransferase [Rhizobiaceae bacterium]
MHSRPMPTDTQCGTIRQLRPSDFPRFRDHLLRLDHQSRRDRFNGSTDDHSLKAYAARCFIDGTTVVGCMDEAHVIGAAELHERPDRPDPTAEIAFSVEQPFQRRGIGRRLFERLIIHALALGYTKLHVTTHAQNAAMKALARSFNATLTFEEGETVGEIVLDPMLEPGLRRIRVATADSSTGFPDQKRQLAAIVN